MTDKKMTVPAYKGEIALTYLNKLRDASDKYAPSNLKRDTEDKLVYQALENLMNNIVEDYESAYTDELQEHFFESECEGLSQEQAFNKYENDYQLRVSEHIYDLATNYK